MENFDIIEKYILGQLPQDEMTKIEHRIKNDPVFRREYEEIRDLIVAIESREFKDSLQGRKIEVPEEDEVESSSAEKGKIISLAARRRKIYRRISAAAAIIFLGFCTWWFFLATPQAEKQLMADAFYTDPGLPSKMSATENYSFYDAMIDYKTGNYEEALEKWSSIESGIGEDTLNYYRAMAYLNLKDTEVTRKLLENISDQSPLYQKSEWRILETYIREKDYDNAKEFFKQLPSDIHPGYDEVKSFLKNH